MTLINLITKEMLMKQVLIVAVKDGAHYQLFLIPEKELENYDLDALDDLYYVHDFTPTPSIEEMKEYWKRGEDAPRPQRIFENKHQEQLWLLWGALQEGNLKKYANPSMPITVDRVVQIGMQN
jgi:hypothetical protein